MFGMYWLMICTLVSHIRMSGISLRLKYSHIFLVSKVLWFLLFVKCNHVCLLSLSHLSSTTTKFCSDDSNDQFWSQNKVLGLQRQRELMRTVACGQHIFTTNSHTCFTLKSLTYQTIQSVSPPFSSEKYFLSQQTSKFRLLRHSTNRPKTASLKPMTFGQSISLLFKTHLMGSCILSTFTVGLKAGRERKGINLSPTLLILPSIYLSNFTISATKNIS